MEGCSLHHSEIFRFSAAICSHFQNVEGFFRIEKKTRHCKATPQIVQKAKRNEIKNKQKITLKSKQSRTGNGWNKKTWSEFMFSLLFQVGSCILRQRSYTSSKCLCDGFQLLLRCRFTDGNYDDDDGGGDDDGVTVGTSL